MALTVSVHEIVHDSPNPLLSVRSHWKRIRLGEIASVLNGFAFKSAQFTKGDGMPLIRIRDVGRDSTDTNYIGEFDDRYIVEPGDLLIGMDGDFKCARWRGPRGLLNQRVCKVALHSDQYRPRFLDFSLPGYLRAINDATSSVTVKHLSSRTVEDIPLPLPPLHEQDEIVAEVEKQFSRLDEAIANLQRVARNLGGLRKAVLSAAVTGRIVETESAICDASGTTFDSGATLLERVLIARRKHWSGRGRYTDPLPPDTRGLCPLPKGWTWASADQLSDFITKGTTPAASRLSEGIGEVQFLKVYNLTFDGSLNYAYRPAFVSRGTHEGELARSTVRPGDILINIVGPPLGQVSLVPAELTEANINQAIARIRPMGQISTRYIAFSLMASEVMDWAIRKAKTTAGQSNLTLELCRAIPIPLPPLAEQHRIVAEVDRRLSIVREVEDQIEANMTRAQRLRQTILRCAIDGSVLPKLQEFA